MKSFLFFLIFISSPLLATNYIPWFSPLWEFQGNISFFFNPEKTIQSPKGNFNDPSKDYTLHLSLGLTPWPYWNTEVELFLTRTSDIPFSYEAVFATVRYEWLDDIRGDPLCLTTGLTLSFPGNRFLRDFSVPYHGEINGELHITVGKEWACQKEWWMRIWALGGWGIANKGNGWIHGMAFLEFQSFYLLPCPLQWGAFTRGVFGLGPNDILPYVPFEGYAPIDHRSIDLGGFARYKIGSIGTFSLLGWYNVYARNFVIHDWGIRANLLVPFSL